MKDVDLSIWEEISWIYIFMNDRIDFGFLLYFRYKVIITSLGEFYFILFSLKIREYVSGVQSWTKGCRQIDEIKQNRFFYGMFYS